jgi:hypothetical protein
MSSCAGALAAGKRDELTTYQLFAPITVGVEGGGAVA